jgi:hypothetical protein
VPALLAAGRPADAHRILSRPGAGGTGPLHDGRIRLLRVRTALALGDAAGARALLDQRFAVEDLREGALALSDTWYAVAERLLAGDGPVDDTIRARARAEHPLPAAYDFRTGPEG